MLFLVTALVLTVCTVADGWLNLRVRKCIFYILSAYLLLLLCFRYYQGTDYPSYLQMYHMIPPSFSEYFANPLWHGEAGFNFLLAAFRIAEIPFEYFAALISAVSLLFMLKAIRCYSPYRIVSLLLMFPSLYMTYFYSVMRQGLVIALFFGAGLPLLFQKKRLWYYLLILLLTQFHSMAAILLLVPRYIDAWGNKSINRLLRYALYAGLGLLCVLGYSNILGRFRDYFGGAAPYMDRTISIPAMAVRLAYGTLLLYMHCQNRGCDNALEKSLFRIYTMGFVIFMPLSFSALLSNRLTAVLKMTEIILIPLELYLLRQKRITAPQKRGALGIRFSAYFLTVVTLAVILVLPNFELYKNMNAYILEGSYYEWVTPLKYPYLNIFEKDLVESYRPLLQ